MDVCLSFKTDSNRNDCIGAVTVCVIGEVRGLEHAGVLGCLGRFDKKAPAFRTWSSIQEAGACALGVQALVAGALLRWYGLLGVGGFFRLCLHARDGDDAHDVMCAAAARQVVDGGGDALGHRAERLGVRQALH